MNCARPWLFMMASAASLGPSCAFDTAPIPGVAAGANAASASASRAGGGAGELSSAAGSSALTQASSQTPAQSSTSAGSGGAVASSPSVTAGTAAAAPVQTIPVIVPPAAAGAPSLSVRPGVCEAASSYGLRLSADVSWDASNAFADSGRGPLELYALVQVENADPKSHAVIASGRVCGISLPSNGSTLTCGVYQYRFTDTLWEQHELPKLRLEGSYECRPDGCSLQLAPTSYLLGFKLDPPEAPWPPAATTQASQYPDHDVDGMPGVSADIISQASALPSAACTSVAGISAGQPGESGRLLLGLRAQLSAALSLGQDCRVAEANGALQALDLRAAGCVLNSATWAAGNSNGNMGQSDTPCPEELRLAVDQGMPNYQVLNAGQAPSVSATGRDTSSSRGTVLRAVRFAPGQLPTCEQVRMATK